jgi:serine/threonine protein kinase
MTKTRWEFPDTTLQRFFNEAATWTTLRHQSILPLLGVDHGAFVNHQALCMVSPWMAKGTLTKYLRNEGAAPIHHKDIVTLLSARWRT